MSCRNSGILGPWQSYGQATKQIIATTAPELGWSPEAKRMIINWVQQLGWTKPPAALPQVEPAAQTASAAGAPKAPSAASLDPAQVRQMVQSLATLQQTAEQMAAGQDELKRDIVQMHSALIDVLVQIPGQPPQPPVASARKPVAAPPPPSSPTTAPHR